MVTNLKVAIGSGVLIFLTGSVFWAGAAYQRITSIESHLINIDSQMATFAETQSNINNLREQLKESQHRVERLEDQIRILK